ncbi:DUF4169 family protein [Pseudooceanicola spongiae]|uniref:DUF4169 family protein n=1 Tax=Pseudooceanicola spongiae TaxID=2613965 RepID=A0A7L9WHS4_9RHOB|nr:DUF4169 family protein [Pseudooceanicola spongiae]QOL79935.1 DUF4169 family protein [Pseudooceanicola spongiae]
MSKVTNLNQFRKSRARDEKRAKGDANAARFGRSKAERTLEEERARLESARLEGHKLDGPEE